MDQPTNFQAQYPLSRKKFWKKMFQKVIPVFMAAAVLGSIIAVAINVIAFGNNPNIGAAFAIFAISIITIFIAIMFFYALYVKAYINRYYYDCNDQFISIQKGVFAPTEIHVQFQKIQDVYVDQDILDRIMGLYDVHIASATATSGIEAHIDGVDKNVAENLKNIFLNKISSGSFGNMQNPSSPINSAQSNSSFNFEGQISSNVYPITGGWSFIAILNRIVFAIFIAAVISSGFGKNFGFGNFFSVFIVAFIVVAIGSIISFVLWKKNYAFDFTQENIYYRTGVISISEKHMPYSSIQDVTVKQGILERLFGYASVMIENATQVTAAGFNGIIIFGLTRDDAAKIAETLKTNVLGKNTAKYGL